MGAKRRAYLRNFSYFSLLGLFFLFTGCGYRYPYGSGFSPTGSGNGLSSSGLPPNNGQPLFSIPSPLSGAVPNAISSTTTVSTGNPSGFDALYCNAKSLAPNLPYGTFRYELGVFMATGHYPSPQELAAGAVNLNVNDQNSREQFALSRVKTPSFLDPLIDAVYQGILGMQTPPSHYAYWEPILINGSPNADTALPKLKGQSYEQMEVSVLATAQFFGKMGASMPNWTNFVFQQYFGRPATPAEVQYITNEANLLYPQLQNNSSLVLQHVGQELFGLPEHLNYIASFIAKAYWNAPSADPGLVADYGAKGYLGAVADALADPRFAALMEQALGPSNAGIQCP